MATFISALFGSTAAATAASTATAAGAAGVTAAGVAAVPAATTAAIAAGEATVITATEAAAAAVAGGTITATAGVINPLTLSGFAALSSVIAAGQRSRALKDAARVERFNVQQEIVRGKQIANETRERLIQTLAQSNVLAGARGVDPTVGSQLVIRRENLREGRRQIANAQLDAEIAGLDRRLQSRNLLARARSARIGGAIQAGFTTTGALLRRAERG